MTVLLFVATILTFLGIDYLVRRHKAQLAAPAVRPQHQSVPALRTPGGLFFSKTHTWLNLIPSGSVQLGIDDFASRMFSQPEITLLKSEGDRVVKGEAIIRMQEGESTVSLRSPIDGRVERLNIHRMGGKVLTQGWAYQIEPQGGASALRNLLLGAETAAWMKNELVRLRDFMAVAHGDAAIALQDGGEPMPGLLNHVSPDACARFEQQFLLND